MEIYLNTTMKKIEKNIFLDVIGYSPTARVMDLLIQGRDFDYSLTDIAENSQIGWTTLHRILDGLIKNNIISYTRNIGKAKMYRINTKNEIVEKLIALHDTVILKTLKESKTPKIVVKHK